MKKIKLLALCAIAAGVVTSCQKDEIADATTEVSSLDLSKAQIEALHEAGVNSYGAQLGKMETIDGVTKDVVYVADYALDLQKLMNGEFALGTAEDGQKQYRTNNLISSSNSTIDIIGYTGSCCALTSTMQTGLQWAVNNYNRINTRLNFRLTFGTDYQSKDMVVYNNGQGGAGGQAEFPSGGRPGKFIQINAGTGSFGGSNVNNVNEHVIGHEIGHAVGFRHTDYARRRCDGSNEGTAGSIGAVHIPGTPTANRWGQSGLDTNSLMISCFDGSEDGEFSNFDVVALEFLY
ncbi:M57 family metalloprotease [Aquimarina brevivitae]|uniref:Dual-action HEIGH metallo-peptidase n=1 Tax=Aquimarina brevivitae TaxID=323412 RepID=A0A4Q7PJ04_9FLAO|nr:M57 family metalloprotease [Aquimarina brevivitae]RZT00019.1 dual-action HEIGH metallo-peptidase [Aquimarina brevivitae]